MNEKIAEAYQILQTMLSRIADINSNCTRILSMDATFAALISLSVKFDRWSEALFIYFDVLSMILFVIAMRARMNIKREVTSLFYYENVAKMNEEQFEKTFDNITQESYLANLQEEIYYTSLVLANKEKWYNLGLIMLVASLICWIVINIWSLF